MKRMKVHCISLSAFTLVGGLSAPGPAEAQDAMAPLDEYLMARDAEVALARSAAPDAISLDATVLTLDRLGCAAHSYLPRTIKKTELIVAGRTKAQMIDAIGAAIAKEGIAGNGTGAMCYMLSKQGYLSSRDGNWHPHLIFSSTAPATWAANLPGSPIFAFNDSWEPLTDSGATVVGWNGSTS
jgi:hypothetical protein